MTRFLQFAAALVVGLAPAWCDDQTKEAPPPKPAPAKTAPKVPAPNLNGRGAAVRGGNPKVGAQKAPPAIPRAPGPQIQRFLRMTPQERDIYIDKAPIANQQRLRTLSDNWEKLPPEERDRRLQLFDSVTRLSKDQQDILNQRLTEFEQLPPSRKVAIRTAYQRLSEVPEADRQAWYDSPAFKERFTPTEQQIIIDLVKYYPNPQVH